MYYFLLIKCIYTVSFCLIKSSYIDKCKKVSQSKLICNTFWDVPVVTKYKSSSVTVTLKIYLFEIQWQILWLIHSRICSNLKLLNGQNSVKRDKSYCWQSLYQQGFISVFNRIDRIIRSKMEYIENWDYILFGYAPLLSVTLNLIK